MKTNVKIDWDAINRILATPEEDFVILAKAGNLDPEVDFIGQDLRDIDFGTCDLAGFNFSRSNLAGADFSKAKIKGARFDNARGLDTAKFPEDVDPLPPHS